MVLGDLLLDVVATAAGRIAHASDICGTVRFRAGGSAANTARAFVALGGRATLVAAVGTDALGRRLAASLRADGVTVRVVTVPLPTGRLVALVEPGGERSFVTQRGAADALDATDLRPTWLARSHGLHLPGYSLFHEPLASAARRAAELARKAGALVSVDLSSAEPLRAMGQGCAWEAIAQLRPSVLFGNTDEYAVLQAGEPVLRLLELARIVVVKEGASGCRVLARPSDDRGEPLALAVATKPISTSDSTGAGDAFDAGFLFSLLDGGVPRGNGIATLGRAALRRAALTGHSAAAALLTGPRPDLACTKIAADEADTIGPSHDRDERRGPPAPDDLG